MELTHTEAVLNKLSKPELVQIILNTEGNLGSEIAKLTTEVKNLLDHSKTWLLLGMSIIGWLKELFRSSVSVGKMSNTQ